jgi:hypothetical protein
MIARASDGAWPAGMKKSKWWKHRAAASGTRSTSNVCCKGSMLDDDLTPTLCCINYGKFKKSMGHEGQGYTRGDGNERAEDWPLRKRVS